MRNQILKSPIMLIGDFPSLSDLRSGIPFTGNVGEELTDCFSLLGLQRHKVSLTNVFNERPEGGNIDEWAIERKAVGAVLDLSLPWAPIPCKRGVVAPHVAQIALKRLHAEITEASPNVIVTLGNTALSALTGLTGISKLRGSLQFFQKTKVIPTYSFEGVLKNFDWKPVVVMDLQKASIESEFPEARLRSRKIYINPKVEELGLALIALSSAKMLSCDIETNSRQITCIGFAPSSLECYVIPFWDKSGNYWKTTEEEVIAYKMVRAVCGNDSAKIFQNGMYDVTYLADYGIPVKNFLHDTMLFSHALHPALPKALGFLGSIYANERSWKVWRTRGEDQLKKEE